MENYITVAQLNNYLKRKFEADAHLDKVFLKGEISNCKIHSRGHIYFSLKDEYSVINAIMFMGNARTLKFEPKDGTKVLVEGKVTVYEASGKYQIIVSKMEQDGIGDLHIAYEKLKNQLEKEGLFKQEHKKNIPKFPKRIGIITAPTGAAIRDILSTIKRRFPISETILFPALVQGEQAKYSIVTQIDVAQDYDIDVIILGRGGGSIEDLWAFNEEIVARAIYSSKIPIISAIGHEVDFTISDFVADLRAPTPTGAAEMAVPDIKDVLTLIDTYKIRSTNALRKRLEFDEKRISNLKNSYVLKNPLNIYEVKEQKLSNLMDKMLGLIETLTSNKKESLLSLRNNLTELSPISNIRRLDEKNKFLREQLNSKINSFLKINNIKINVIKENKVLFSPDFFLKSYTLKLDSLVNKLMLLNPLTLMDRGYVIIKKEMGKTINKLDNVDIGDKINIRLSDGILDAIIVEKRKL